MRRWILAFVLAVAPLLAWQAADPAPVAADTYPGTNGVSYIIRSDAGNGDILAFNATNFSAATYAPIVTAGDVSSMSLSPDGRRLAYASTAYAPSAIFVMDVYTQVSVRITNPIGSVQHRSPSWSPDGQFIAYSAFDPITGYTMRIVSSDGAADGEITTGAQPDHITWNPANPNLITYVTAVSGTIRTRNLLAGTDTSLVFQARDRVAYSPDGLSIYFSDRSDGQLYRYLTSGITATQLSFAADRVSNVGGIAPSPDGTRILYRYTDSINGNSTIVRTDINGAAQEFAATNPTLNESFTWGPAIVPGYRMVASDGGIFTFGSSTFQGSTGGIVLNQPIVGMATSPSGLGYWLVSRDGGIFTFGDADFYGSAGAIVLNQPIVGMAATPSGRGYWLVSSDGGIFSFGDAIFYGSTGAIVLNQPIVGMAPAPNGGGYWLVARDGGIFNFGSANFAGSTGALTLNRPIVGMAPDVDGNGYWLVASDGGIFAFGSAGFYGSTGAITLNRPIVGMSRTPTGNGYWLVASDGGIFSFGDASFQGSTGGIVLNQPIVGMGG